MASREAEVHVLAQERLRTVVSTVVERSWVGLPGYDEEHVALFHAQTVPTVLAAQRQSAALTEAFLARRLRRPPFGVDRTMVTGAAVRAGNPPDQVYRRPFVTVWSALAAGTAYEQAVAAGLARATSTAAMDVQLASRATFHETERLDDGIRGYQRVADGGACSFCQMVDGAFVKSADAMPLHNRCGCSLEPVTDAVDPTPLPEGVAVHDHGELGPVLGDPAHDFTSSSDL